MAIGTLEHAARAPPYTSLRLAQGRPTQVEPAASFPSLDLGPPCMTGSPGNPQGGSVTVSVPTAMLTPSLPGRWRAPLPLRRTSFCR